MICHAKEQAAAARARSLETEIKRFAKVQQRRLRKLVKSSSRLGDILYSFPAAAFAVVSGHGTHNQRGEAVRLIKDGAELRQVADVLELPFWTRRLPPEAFEDRISNLPNGEAFARKVVNLIPADPEATAMWLRWLLAGNEACHEEFALWLARQKVYRVENDFGAPVLPLAAYAWFSGLDEGDRNRRMVETPWHKQIGLRKAVEAMCSWYERVMLDLTAGDRKRGPGRYRNRKRKHGYTLLPLRTPQDLHEEGEAMNHCVGTYSYEVARGNCLIYSVRHGGRRVATLELRWVYGSHRPPVVNQLLGHSNKPVGPDVQVAVAEWLRDQSGIVNSCDVAHLALDETRWRAFWGGYVKAKGDRVLVPERPSNQLLQRFSQDVGELARCIRALQ
jgi:hypothetical protein